MDMLSGSATNQTKQLVPVPRCDGTYPSKALQFTTYGTLMVLSLIGNLLIVIVFCRNKLLKTPVHYFIVNMAIADLIISVVVLPWGIFVEYHESVWPIEGVIGTIICKLGSPVWGVSVAVSILTMVMVAVDRFHAVLFAMQPPLISRKRCRVIIALIWITALSFRAHYFYAWKTVRHGNFLVCRFQWTPDSHTEYVEKITWFSFLGMSTFAALILTVLYSITIGVLYRQQNGIQMATEMMKRRAKENRNVACMLISVVVIFYAVWTPHQVESLIHFLKPDATIPCFFYWFGAYVLALLYPVLNPVVYYTFNEKYRNGFKEILCCKWLGGKCCHDNITSQSSKGNRPEELMALQETCTTYNSA